jgi:hypothetical protein
MKVKVSVEFFIYFFGPPGFFSTIKKGRFVRHMQSDVEFGDATIHKQKRNYLHMKKPTRTSIFFGERRNYISRTSRN